MTAIVADKCEIVECWVVGRISNPSYDPQRFILMAVIEFEASSQLNTREVQRRVNELRSIDNVSNWYYLAREYIVLGLIVGSTLAIYYARLVLGFSWLWCVPVTAVAVFFIGACQHRLTTLAHEASHYMLFRNRLLNELISDWFCMFPMLSNTHHYRVQHMAHHQFVNDAEKDPDIAQMEESGHRFHFPMEPRRFVWHCVIKQFLWMPSLIRYIRIRESIRQPAAVAALTSPKDHVRACLSSSASSTC